MLILFAKRPGYVDTHLSLNTTVLQSVCRANMSSSADRFHHCAVAADALSAALELAARHNKSNFCECCGKIVVFPAFVTFSVVFVFN